MKEGAEPSIDPAALSEVVATPRWLRDLGRSAWLLVGVTLLVVGLVWLLALTDTIVMPVITAAVVAAVASPVIAWLQRRGLPRGLAAALMMVAAIALGIGMVLLIVGGITNETSGLSGQLNDAKNTIEGWLKDLGIDPSTAKNAKDTASSSSTAAVGTLLHGVVQGLEELSSLVFFLVLTALSLFFMLKDGPLIRAVGGTAPGGARRGGPHDRRARAAVAAGLLLRGHDRGTVQRGRGRGRCARAGRPAPGDDRPDHLSSAPTSPISARGPRGRSRCCSRWAAPAPTRRSG